MRNLHKVLLIHIVLLNSCATFNKSTFKDDYIKLTEKNCSLIDGSFEFYPINRYGREFKKSSVSSFRYANVYQSIVNENYNKKKSFDSLLSQNNTYSVDLKLKNFNQLRVIIHENEVVIKDTILNGKFKKGMYYLDNVYLKYDCIPFLFGGYQHNKRRIAISKKGNLIINETVDNAGAFLFLLWGGVSYNSAYEYKRVIRRDLYYK